MEVKEEEMISNIVIALLAAALVVTNVPWYAACDAQEKIAVCLGYFSILFIFDLFLEDLWEKWRKYRKRVKEVKEYVERLQRGERRK